MADLTPRESGKQRAGRIRLDHYRQTDAVGRARAALLWVAGLLSAGAVAWWFTAPGGAVAFSHGPISVPHATWESRCDACHTPGRPLGAQAVRLTNVPEGADGRCLVCHVVSSHYTLPQDTDQGCAGCHREHRGRMVDLTHVADRQCTVCHADPASISGVEDARLVAASSYPDNHPAFASLPNDMAGGDPGRLAFSHSRHMRLGLSTSEGGPESDWLRYRDLPEGDRAAYMRRDDRLEDRVQLRCDSCHRLQSRATSVAAEVQAAGGGVYLPVEYEQHCKACHPLSAIAGGAAEAIPHGLTDDETDRLLTRLYRGRWFDQTEAAARPERTTPIPGRSKILRRPRESALEAIANNVAAAKAGLRQRCVECHEMAGDGLAVTPTNVPVRWLTGAWFRHEAHEVFDCGDCHAGAYATDSDLPLVDRGLESRRVMLPEEDNCVRCHAPRSAGGSGIRHDCALCHRYHDGGILEMPGPPQDASHLFTSVRQPKEEADAAARD